MLILYIYIIKSSPQSQYGLFSVKSLGVFAFWVILVYNGFLREGAIAMAQNVYLRSITGRDIPEVYLLYSDSRVCSMCGTPPVGDILQAEQYTRIMVKNADSFAVMYGEKFAGIISVKRDIHRFNPKAYMLGYRLKKAFWGKGIMSRAVKRAVKYAFDTKGADIVCAYCFDFNAASRRVLEKCGFSYEGMLKKEYLRYDGRLLDSRTYSILYEEYRQKE